MSFKDTINQLYFENVDDWRLWLEENYDKCKGIWFIFIKKGVDIPGVSYEDAVCEALCFGWIDSTARKLDSQRHMLMFTPRKKGSVWSKLNKKRVERLISENRIRPAGLQKIQAAKEDGSWTILDSVEDLILPDELQNLLSKDKVANENFNNFSASAKKGILWWIKSAKTDKTRLGRIEKTAKMAAQNLKANIEKGL